MIICQFTSNVLNWISLGNLVKANSILNEITEGRNFTQNEIDLKLVIDTNTNFKIFEGILISFSLFALLFSCFIFIAMEIHIIRAAKLIKHLFNTKFERIKNYKFLNFFYESSYSFNKAYSLKNQISSWVTFLPSHLVPTSTQQDTSAYIIKLLQTPKLVKRANSETFSTSSPCSDTISDDRGSLGTSKSLDSINSQDSQCSEDSAFDSDDAIESPVDANRKELKTVTSCTIIKRSSVDTMRDLDKEKSLIRYLSGNIIKKKSSRRLIKRNKVAPRSKIVANRYKIGLNKQKIIFMSIELTNLDRIMDTNIDLFLEYHSTLIREVKTIVDHFKGSIFYFNDKKIEIVWNMHGSKIQFEVAANYACEAAYYLNKIIGIINGDLEKDNLTLSISPTIIILHKYCNVGIVGIKKLKQSVITDNQSNKSLSEIAKYWGVTIMIDKKIKEAAEKSDFIFRSVDRFQSDILSVKEDKLLKMELFQLYDRTQLEELSDIEKANLQRYENAFEKFFEGNIQEAMQSFLKCIEVDENDLLCQKRRLTCKQILNKEKLLGKSGTKDYSSRIIHKVKISEQ